MLLLVISRDIMQGEGISTDSMHLIFSLYSSGQIDSLYYGKAGQCGDTVGIELTLLDADIADVDTFPAICQDAPAFNFTYSSPTIPGGIWSGPGTDGLTGEFSPSNAGSGIHSIKYTTSGTCSASDSVQIVANISILCEPFIPFTSKKIKELLNISSYDDNAELAEEKHFLKDYTSKINEGLKRINLPENPTHLYDPLRYFFQLGGKRIRPILTLLAAERFDKNAVNNSLNAALAIEIFHNFSLVHDDIMDEAPVRRGQQTVHKKWDQNIAILSGDVTVSYTHLTLPTILLV